MSNVRGTRTSANVARSDFNLEETVQIDSDKTTVEYDLHVPVGDLIKVVASLAIFYILSISLI
jgi:hypothetical protein